MYSILSGAIMMGCLVAGFFFVKFWKRTRERLFFIFALAFWSLAIERLALGYLGANHEQSIKVYLIRLCAFLFILVGIIDKNRKKEIETAS